MAKNPRKVFEKVKHLREFKGKELEAFEEIEKAKIIFKNMKNWEYLAKVYWEESLNWQHIVLNKQANDASEEENEYINALKNMEQAAKNAHRIIKKHHLEDLLGISHRFIGRVYDYKKEYTNAKKQYKKAISIIEKQKNTEQILELKGYIASDLVREGSVEEGIQLAISTFYEYEITDVGKNLKKTDFVRWAIWRTGIFPFLVDALTESNAQFDEKLIKEFLTKSREILKDPTGKKKWGDPNFEYRANQIKRARRLINRLFLILLSVYPSFAQKFL